MSEKCKYWSVTQNTCVHSSNIIKISLPVTFEEAQKQVNKPLNNIHWKEKQCTNNCGLYCKI